MPSVKIRMTTSRGGTSPGRTTSLSQLCYLVSTASLWLPGRCFYARRVATKHICRNSHASATLELNPDSHLTAESYSFRSNGRFAPRGKKIELFVSLSQPLNLTRGSGGLRAMWEVALLDLGSIAPWTSVLWRLHFAGFGSSNIASEWAYPATPDIASPTELMQIREANQGTRNVSCRHVYFLASRRGVFFSSFIHLLVLALTTASSSQPYTAAMLKSHTRLFLPSLTCNIDALRHLLCDVSWSLSTSPPRRQEEHPSLWLSAPGSTKSEQRPNAE